MNLLAGVCYDPASAVSKATTSAIAMTALDTVNLRLAVKAPPSGKLFARLAGVLHGATTFPQIFLGVLRGATVMGRQAPMSGGGNLAATTLQNVEARFLITGLTPGQQHVLDAAYGVETVVASTALKYGGPNNTSANDAFGGFVFELYDPCPVYTPAEPGSPSEPTAPTLTVHDKLDAIDDFVDTEIADIRNRLPAALVGGRMDASVGAMASGVITAAAHAAGAIDAAALAADAGTELATAVWASGTRLLTAGTNIVLAKGTGVTGFNDLSAAQVNTECDTALADVGLTGVITGRIDAAVSSRLASAGYTAPDNATIAAIDGNVDDVKAKTDSLSFTVASKLDVNVLVVNGVTVGGAGTAGDPWGPA